MEYNVFENEEKKVLNKKKVLIVVIIVIATILAFSGLYAYKVNNRFKNIIDVYVFKKEVLSENLPYIAIDTSANIFTYDKYVAVLDKNNLKGYSGENKEFELEIKVNNPLIYAEGSYLVIAENDGKKIYCIDGKKIIWEKEIEGQIKKIYINKNGYCAVVLKDTLYKSIVKIFKQDGQELFTSFFASTYLTDISISNDNKYVAVSEVDTSKINVESRVKILSVTKAANSQEDYVEYISEFKQNKIITKIKYIDKNNLLCMYDDEICLITGQNSQTITNIDNKQNLFASIDLNGSIIKTEKINAGLLENETQLKIINAINKKEKTYEIEGIIKNIKTRENIIAINLGSEIHFINTSGWLIKKYISEYTIKDYHLFNNGAIIQYRDKIEILNF